jgi:hypothetical protein
MSKSKLHQTPALFVCHPSKHFVPPWPSCGARAVGFFSRILDGVVHVFHMNPQLDRTYCCIADEGTHLLFLTNPLCWAGRSWARGGNKRRPNQHQRPHAPGTPMPVKLSDVIMQLKAEGTLPRGVSSPGFFDSYTPVVFNQDRAQQVSLSRTFLQCEPAQKADASTSKFCPQVEGPRSEVRAASFKVQAAVRFGDRLCVVGGSAELGAWSVDHAVTMSWSDDNWWHCTVDLPAGHHEFKVCPPQRAADHQYCSVATCWHASCTCDRVHR